MTTLELAEPKSDVSIRTPAATRAIAAGACVMAALLTMAGVLALTTLGRAFPSLFFDPFGSVSNVCLPSWLVGSRWSSSPRFPDRVVAVDGEPIAGAPHRRSQEIAARVALAHERGRDSVAIELARGGERYQLTCTLGTIGELEIAVFFGLYALCGVLTLWSGASALFLAGRRAAGRAYAFWSVGSALFLFTFYDYHTSARLAPLFTLSTVWLVLGNLGLALAFPSLPASLAGRSSMFMAIGGAIGGTMAALWLVFGPRAGIDLVRSRIAAGLAVIVSMVIQVAALALRARSADGRRRLELRSAWIGLALIPGTVAVSLMPQDLYAVATVHALMPLIVPVLPLSLGYSLIRHNVFATSAVVTKRVLLVPMATLAAIAAIVIWLLARKAMLWLDPRAAAPLVFAATGFLMAFALLYGAARRRLFPAITQFRPTIEQLCDQFGSASEPTKARRSIEAVVRRWLPATSVEVLEPARLCGIQHLPHDAMDRLRLGSHVFTDESPIDRKLLVPMRSLGALYGVLMCAAKRGGAVYTEDDLALLDIVAGLGGLALHNGAVVAELEELHRLHVGASEGDKRLALSTLGAEISHEINHSLIFFRYLLTQIEHGPVEPTDLSIGQREIERLQRTFENLKRLDSQPLQIQPIRLDGVVAHAIALVRDALVENRIRAQVDIPADFEVLADPDPLLQVLSNLLRNAAQAAPIGGNVGVRARRHRGHSAIEVWDEGPGVPAGMEKAIFQPWFTTRKGGTGLGLAVVQRIANRFNWPISVERRDGCTWFVLRAVHANPNELDKEP